MLEVVSGPAAGRKIRLGTGQEVRVGRTEWADYSFPHDGLMSSVHFSLQLEPSGCFVQDLNSSNGTCVNGRPISERTMLSPGDEILAGETRFVLHAEGDLPARTASAARKPVLAPAALPQQPAQRALPEGRRWTFTAEKCGSGLALCRGSVAEIPPQEVATLLCQISPVSLIVDFRNLGSGAPAELTARDYLFDWLAPEAAALASPLLISQTDLLAWPALVEAGWGLDAVVCLFSQQDKPAMLAHLRRALRVKPNREDLNAGVLGLCWPGILGMLLAHGKPGFVQQLMAGIDAVMVELPDLPETWQLYGDTKLPGVLEKMGFVHTK
jgi:hypothetical protein